MDLFISYWSAQSVVSCSVSFLALISSVRRTTTEDVKEIVVQNIDHYEAVDYNVSYVHKQHLDVMNLQRSSVVTINFSAFGRNFCLLLEQHKRLFSKDTKFRTVISNSEEKSGYDTRTAYTGTVKGDPNSFIMGHIFEGKFDGSFFAFGESFHLEPAERYFHFKTPFHSIIFPASSVKFNSSGIQRKITRVKDLQSVVIQVTSERMRRDNPSNSSLNTCSLHIAADHSFFEYVGSGSASATVAEMVYHVAMTDKRFRATDFNQDGGSGDDIGFVIKAATVFKDAESEGTGSLGSPQDIGSLDYLVKWSELDHSAYCLSLLFTYRDFFNGVLGIAWVGQPELEKPGGICSGKVLLPEKDQHMSFNTALVTFLNFGRKVPRKVSTITVMHEFGHSFGSEHDPDTCQCSPGGSDGNFVMYSRASDGHEPNNILFSPCSKQEMSPVISLKGPQCFIAHNNGSYCGNRIVEEGEDCDCGSPGECLEVDKCCVARDDDLNIPGCTVRQGRQCSSVAGECCTEECIPESKGRVCQAETECSLETTCNGNNGRCPKAESKPNNVTCNGGSNTCLHGSCTGSICALYETSECECHQDTDQMCHVCCNNSLGACVSAQDFLGRVVLKPSGSTCKSHQGYCDSHGKCVTVDSENELNKLRDTFRGFFAKKAMSEILSWINSLWYYVLLIIGSIFLVAVVFFKFTSRGKRSLQFVRRAIFPYSVRNEQHNQQDVHVRTSQVSVDEFVDNELEFELGTSSGDINLGEPNAYESHESRLQVLFPDVSSNDLISAILHSTSEQAAINRLRAQGYAMTEN